MGARDPSLDRLRAACELRRAHRAILARQFLELGRHRLDGRDRARIAQRGGRRSRGRAVQRGAEVRLLVDGVARARTLPHRPRDLGILFRRGDHHRDSEGRGAHSQLRGDCGHHCLDHACVRGDLGARLDAGDDARLRDPRLGVASSSQMAEEPCFDRLAGPAPAACGRGLMRQGETAQKGGWIGNATGGVKAPEPILLPDPAMRFARTAERLPILSKGHPMEGWLDFMAKLARAQHHVATTLAPLITPDEATVEQAVAARIPPIAADGHRRDAAWRDGLALLLDSAAGEELPTQAAPVATELRARGPAATEALADAFLRGVVDEKDAGLSFWIAAALQVHFTRLAGRLPTRALRLLEQRSLCPCCGSTSSASLVTGAGQNPGARYLYCSLCSTAWNYSRAVCVTCGGLRTLSLRGIEGDSGVVNAETCDECGTYSKMAYQAKDMQADPYADDLATLGLDVMVGETGWARHAPNPLLLVG